MNAPNNLKKKKMFSHAHLYPLEYESGMSML